jgi:hypothetical protein
MFIFLLALSYTISSPVFHTRWKRFTGDWLSGTSGTNLGFWKMIRKIREQNLRQGMSRRV